MTSLSSSRALPIAPTVFASPPSTFSKSRLLATFSTNADILNLAQSDPSFHVRNVIADGLSMAAPMQVWTKLVKEDTSPTVRATALAAFVTAFAGSEEAVKIVQERAKEDKDYQVRAAAITAAASLDASVANAIFEAAIKDANPQITFAVFGAFASSPSANSWILPAIQLHATTSPHLFVRSSAIDAAAVLDPPATPEFLFGLYEACLTNAPDSRAFKDVRQQIVDLLVTKQGDEAVKALEKALKDPFAQVRNPALAALRGLNIPNLPQDLPEVDALEFSPYRNGATTEFIQRSTPNPRARVVTNKGVMTLELFAKDAPIHVASFLGLAKSGKYDGLTWHRVVDNFVIQGGDPDGGGYGDSGYSLRNEINIRSFDRGAIGMPRSSAFNSGGSQLFINHVPTPGLDGLYTVFGKVVQGLDVIDKIEIGDLIVSVTVL
ncbi:cyclophilin-like domain-containing protein [Chytridium lagenaria]|nr:cyclophilin-like domain-containing protein [Chytridium lagenaria]